MHKSLLFSLLMVVASLSVKAQFQYTVNATTTTYSPLSGASSLNGTIIWDEDKLTAPMPFTWIMDNTISQNVFNLNLSLPAVVLDTVGYPNLNGFILGDIDIADRGLLSNVSSRSPIRYLTTGTSPNRIFKLELANAGFWEEYDLYSSMNDSFNLQIWIYETTNIVELHFGPSRITHFGDYPGYHVGTDGLLFGYGKNADIYGNSTGSFYHLQGNPAAPTVDSFTLSGSSSSPATLNAWPADGQVYRFTPKGSGPTAVGTLASMGHINLYPNPAHDQLTIEGAQAGDLVSVRSMIGQVLMSTRIGSNREALNISALPAGSNVLVLTGSNGDRATSHFVKQ